MSDLFILLPALSLCALLILTHTYLGLHVLSRGIIFVDLALAQVAALGVAVALMLGMDAHGRHRGFRARGAAVGNPLAEARARAFQLKNRLPHDAFIYPSPYPACYNREGFPKILWQEGFGLESRFTLVVISDTHGLHRHLAVPDGDVLIHCGDWSMRGHLAELRSFNAFLESQPHSHKIVIAGNHDFCFENQPREARMLLTAAHYLQDESLTIEGIKFYGSPWQPWFHDWAFNLARGALIRAKWDLIPPDTAVLITHGPPHSILDRTYLGESVGCEELLPRVRELRPALHLFGHIHEDRGCRRENGTLFVNASICDVRYRPLQAPFRLRRTNSGWEVLP